MDTTTQRDPIDVLIDSVRQRLAFGQSKEEIRNDLRKTATEEQIYFAYVAAQMLQAP